MVITVHVRHDATKREYHVQRESHLVPNDPAEGSEWTVAPAYDLVTNAD